MAEDQRPGTGSRLPVLESDYGRLLTPGEAAGLAGIGAKALAARADRGTLPCFRAIAGGHRRYREADIRAIAREVAARNAVPSGLGGCAE